ncbi:type I-B CRISPR-associated protein Cas8b1/Cst1 [Pyrococcus kukulkanii]|uniref:type I-B CRISPR-associated protein Cas8b1/Cst1 n=1 Tax=Pyrococcus kukulkanii TaxID=1609559 RepID=UPI003565FA50
MYNTKTLDDFLGKASHELPTFEWTGHPFVDAGLTAILLLSKKSKPQDLTWDDIEKAVEFVSDLYARKEWRIDYLHGMVMPNNGIIMANPGALNPIKSAIKRAAEQEKKKINTNRQTNTTENLKIPASQHALKVLSSYISKKFDQKLAQDLVSYLKSLSIEDLGNPKKEEDLIKKLYRLIVDQEFIARAIKRKIRVNLEELLQDTKRKNGQQNGEGTCVICGKRPAYDKKERYRSIFPLLGTGDVPNYFPSGNRRGEYICSHCLFLAQFMPLIAYRMQRLLIIHTNPPEFMLRFHEEALNDVRKTQLASNARGFRRPENFLFEKLMEIGRDLELGKLDGVSITLYYFVSNNQGQEIDIIYIPNPVLRFIAFAGPEFRKIANMGWAKGCTRRRSEEEVVRECRNEVYHRLLENESILPYFVDIQNRRVNSSWRLLEFYCLEVLSLEKDALEFVRDVADRIVETLEKLPDNKLARRVRELERADKLYQFEAFFIRVEKDRQELGVPKALITFDEFATLLTSYGEDLNVSWRTVKHLILFRIYEKLHDRLMKVKEEEEEVEEE